MNTLPLLAVLALAAPSEPSFSARAWQSNEAVYRAILAHPFLAGLADGTLDREVFDFYLVQDARYLADFAHALETTAAKSPSPEWAALLRQHARDSLQEERTLHERLLKEHGLTAESERAIQTTPEAFAYASFLVATAHRGSFGESIAALLPCYWVYGEVGRELARRGSPKPAYQQWIDNYASEGYDQAVRAVIAIADEMAAAAGPEERRRMHENFERGVRFEWMFWDGAYHRRSWPPRPSR